MSKQIVTEIDATQRGIRLADGRVLPLGRSVGRALVMGTLNVTPDSFSDGGRHTSRSMAIGRALEMEGEGADIIDVGGESSRPGAAPVDVDEEMRRVLPVIEGIRKASDIPISVDTYKAITAKAALDTGADIINDISGLRFDAEMAGLAAVRRCPVVIMHMQGTPRDMQKNPHYENCVEEIGDYFRERVRFAEAQGMGRGQIILDPGIGFGKRLVDNLDILANLGRFRELGLPILVGASRKQFISMIHPSTKPADQRLGGSIAAVIAAMLGGADVVRVHDVEQTVEALKVAQALREASS